MSIVTKNLTYKHPDNTTLFDNISFSIYKGDKVALIGNNGTGKSTLLHLISGFLKIQKGEIIASSSPYYVPQHFGQFNELTVAEALNIETKLKSLHAILDGDASTTNFTLLDDDWNIEERSLAALSVWGLGHIQLNQRIGTLSGGEKTKVFLAGIQIHNPQILLMDEPTNHLDRNSREKLYNLILSTPATMIVVSHDRILLNKLSYIYELSKLGITAYGGNYDFYKDIKRQQQNALFSKLESKEKELRVIRKTAQESAERQEKHDSRGKKANIRKGIPKIVLNSLQSKAEKSTAKLKETHTEKVSDLSEEIAGLRKSLPNIQGMKLDFSSSDLHTGKILISAKNINFGYNNNLLWKEPLSFEVRSGDRLSLLGNNGSGKTTLLKLITGQLEPTEGIIVRADFNYVYIDQEYSIIQPDLSIYEQVKEYNTKLLAEHELKMILNRYLFPFGTWDKKCKQLSGGEKMRLVFCCLMISNQAPDLFILDEPTNNLDIHSIDIITTVMNEYRGTILVVSHDLTFTKEIRANTRYLELV
ncbi:ribosomal protection-like ABC-F family protein [Parabacteroides provencensis]|uniref:ribosomal protection-like ABC-F family protein n=1 Tax=Parabacteroides provencensis TaxID=1944636 RepID=UPI000C15EDF8|nr:ABC-F family ATP-binding cassette domain-containing protein [Parabacteroides provencensis]